MRGIRINFTCIGIVGRISQEGKIIFDSNKLSKYIIKNNLSLCDKCSLYPACYGPCCKNSPQEDSNFRCLLSNLGLSKEELVIYNFKLNLLQQEI